MFHYKRIVWALRKLRLPVDERAIVLDVGSGGNPHPRSDILLDRLTGAEHRSGTPMLIDRPAVIGDATKLPFKDKSIDYIIASHILEHMENPEVFIKELQRVGKAGYIETPNAICERLVPCEAHCLEIALVNDVLRIHKKTKPLEDSFLGGMNFLRGNRSWKKFYCEDPDMFHVRYFWSDKIEYAVHNPDASCEWVRGICTSSSGNEVTTEQVEDRRGWRYIGLLVFGWLQKYRRKKRLKKFDIFSILACPECRGDLIKNERVVACSGCGANYSSLPYLNFDKVVN